MLRVALTALILVAVSTAGHAQAPTSQAQSQPIKPGTYGLAIVFGGGTIDGTLVLEAVGDSLAAKLKVADHASPVRTLVRKGSRLTLTGGGEGMLLVYELDFRADSVSGSFTYNGEAGTVAGKRRN